MRNHTVSVLLFLAAISLAAATSAEARPAKRRAAPVRQQVPKRTVRSVVRSVPRRVASKADEKPAVPMMAKPETRRARPRVQEAGMGFGVPSSAPVADAGCRSEYTSCLSTCRGGSECSADCGIRCLNCDFKRTGRTDALATSCH